MNTSRLEKLAELHNGIIYNNKQSVAEQCLEFLTFTNRGGIKLCDLKRKHSERLIFSGSCMQALRFDPDCEQFMNDLFTGGPTEENVRAVTTMLKAGVFKFSAHHLCLATKHGWPFCVLNDVAKFIVVHTKATFLDGNIGNVMAIMTPLRCGKSVEYPGRQFDRKDWCCNFHYTIANAELPPLELPTISETSSLDCF